MVKRTKLFQCKNIKSSFVHIERFMLNIPIRSYAYVKKHIFVAVQYFFIMYMCVSKRIFIT